MIFADIKTNVKQQGIKDLAVVFFKLLTELRKSVKHHKGYLLMVSKEGVYFSFNFGWCFNQLDIN